ncbi:BQ5605_C035g11419 [Microbotryum silenes-dioicae]|uniref:BQ5605_C035g11419 protein n=1 Tax=Microbotryum silenes-dioicae TaxID=796604 RepID=A0A2X0MG00_9BASI|nr:BQ5605_C035g11419 [Microbotryum silenes-dioicae]
MRPWSTSNQHACTLKGGGTLSKVDGSALPHPTCSILIHMMRLRHNF